jgi:hypothetical protein
MSNTDFDNMTVADKMRAVLEDMNEPCDAPRQTTLTGEYLKVHGIEHHFIFNNTGLLQLLNERPDIVMELRAKYGL